MRRVFFTADCHFNHANIIKFCNRPFIKYKDMDEELDWVSEDIKWQRCQEMNEEIIRRWNSRVSPEDVVYHVGDFLFGHSSDILEFEGRLNGTIVHILGNHDKDNGVKSYIKYAIMTFGGLNIYVVHEPPEENQIGTLETRIMSSVDFILCGHVHNKWKHKIIPYNTNKEITCINVGMDVWNFEPINIQSILKYLAKVRRGEV